MCAHTLDGAFVFLTLIRHARQQGPPGPGGLPGELGKVGPLVSLHTDIQQHQKKTTAHITCNRQLIHIAFNSVTSV